MEKSDDVLDEDVEAIKAAFLEGWHEAMTDVPSRSIWEVLDEIEDSEED